MAIVASVNWISGEITISRTGMTLLQASPEIRGLDVNALRLELRDLEDDLDGRPWPKTHIHSTQETLSGVVYARKFTIIAPYFITFEDGIYSVIADNSANHNILDVRTYNSVSLSVSNSAGLQAVTSGSGLTPEQHDRLVKIEQAHYNRRVWDKVGSTITIYDSDDLTPLYVFDTNSDLSDITPQ
jgi:hypothetical protein